MKQLIRQILKEDSLVNIILNRIKNDGWSDTAKLVGGMENLFDIIGNNKENVISFLLSHYNDLHIEKRGGEILLMDRGYPLIKKVWRSKLTAYDRYFSDRLNMDTYNLYINHRRDLIRELVSRFPDLYSERVDVYADPGHYTKYDEFYL
jgi:hypothetical protein